MCQGDVGANFIPDFCADVWCPPNTVWGIQNPPNHNFCHTWMYQTDNWITFIHLWSGTGVVHDGGSRHLSLYIWTASITAKCSLGFKLTLQAWTLPTPCPWPKYESVNGIYFNEGAPTRTSCLCSVSLLWLLWFHCCYQQEAELGNGCFALVKITHNYCSSTDLGSIQLMYKDWLSNHVLPHFFPSARAVMQLLM